MDVARGRILFGKYVRFSITVKIADVIKTVCIEIAGPRLYVKARFLGDVNRACCCAASRNYVRLPIAIEVTNQTKVSATVKICRPRRNGKRPRIRPGECMRRKRNIICAVPSQFVYSCYSTSLCVENRVYRIIRKSIFTDERQLIPGRP